MEQATLSLLASMSPRAQLNQLAHWSDTFFAVIAPAQIPVDWSRDQTAASAPAAPSMVVGQGSGVLVGTLSLIC